MKRTPLKLKSLFSICVLMTSYILLSQCTYVTPEEENPVPGLEQSSTFGKVQNGILSARKSFFGIRINQETNLMSYEDKTWLCGWAPVRQSGKFKNVGGLTGAPYNTRHCNMVFRITEDGTGLEALEVNVDKPNVADWQAIFVIPIKKHYFYEKDVDSRGRELNKYAKVSDRKNWKQQPFMDLDLQNIAYKNREKSPISFFGAYHPLNGGHIFDVHDIELSQDSDGKNFFAWTGTLNSSFFGSDIQNEIRFNFLEFEGTDGFKVTPYDPNTAPKNMNILHILGTREDGINEKNYAAHWDFSKPVEICLNGFPEDGRYKGIGVEVIEETNKTLKKIGTLQEGQPGFVVSEKNFKYDFDLRCPSINFVMDPELSMGAPLGIGLVNSNIKTGEILWGSAIIWGGMIDYLVNRDSESSVDALARNTHEVLERIQSVKDQPYFTDVNNQLKMPNINGMRPIGLHDDFDQSELVDSFRTMLQTHVQSKIQAQGGHSPQTRALEQAELVRVLGLEDEALRLQSYYQEASVVDQLTANGQDPGQVLQAQIDELVETKTALVASQVTNNLDSDALPNFRDFQVNEEEYKRSLFQKSNLGVSAVYSDTDLEKRDSIVNNDNPDEVKRKLIADYKSILRMDADFDNTIADHYGDWLAMTSEMGFPEREEAAISVIKNVMLHEWGHVLGLGHQFKGNILPERGTVPEELYQTMVQRVENGNHYTSVMDYQSGQTEVSLKPEDVTMRTQDELVLQYLYNQKIATFEPGDEDFVMVDLPIDGSIPRTIPHQGRMRQVRYMPQCSDLEAWLASDPYCRRWDRGHDAPSIVDDNFNQFKDSFIKRMNSFTQATGGSDSYMSWRLWSDTYSLMNFNRTFYDKMRFDMIDDLHRPSYAKVFYDFIADRDVLVQFSKACVDPLLASSEYQDEFAKLVLQPTAIATGKIYETERRGADYDSVNSTLMSKYRTAMRSFADKSYIELSDAERKDLENNLYDQGVAFTELHKLCRANRKSLEYTKTMLSLPGYDHTEYDFEGSVVPTGMRGANARAQYNKIFGRYITLGILPLKLAALSVLTSPSSTMRYGYWNISKPQYSGKKGNYSYYAFYPEEYTDIVKSSVENNMSFGGVDLGDKASLSLANLYMSYFLRRDNWMTRDNLGRGFDDIFLADVKGQTNFRVSISPVLFEAIVDQEISDSIIFGFTPKIFSRAKDGLITLPEAYILPHGNTVVRGTDGQIVMPLTKLRFIGPKTAYIWAVEVTYEPTRNGDPLQGFSVKSIIRTLSNKVLDECMRGENGLSSFFTKNNRTTDEEGEVKEEKFDGFTTSSNIAVSSLTQQQFENSVIEQFDKYNSLDGVRRPDQRECIESRKGLGLIGATALSLNGWILPQVFQYLE